MTPDLAGEIEANQLKRECLKEEEPNLEANVGKTRLIEAQAAEDKAFERGRVQSRRKHWKDVMNKGISS